MPALQHMARMVSEQNRVPLAVGLVLRRIPRADEVEHPARTVRVVRYPAPAA